MHSQEIKDLWRPYVCVYIYTHVFVYLFIYSFIHLSFVDVSICSFIYLFVFLFITASVNGFGRVPHDPAECGETLGV